MSIVEIVERQDDIIEAQAAIINELFTMLAQYATIEEIDSTGCLSEIKRVALMRQELQ